ncbi:uncharacterized protein LOC121301059 [Polyodon spathula]|uniref:uncharacterized protein LOC121301059 n=1 Tax=Polyodon spathula TaxID=7913 RepID=UPI001B7EB723|nr:uncharacterized protein LOC121301059 [Polyodon spathula]
MDPGSVVWVQIASRWIQAVCGFRLPADGSRQCCVGSDCQQMDPGSVVWVQIASRWIQAVLCGFRIASRWIQAVLCGFRLPADGSRQCCVGSDCQQMDPGSVVWVQIASRWIQAVFCGFRLPADGSRQCCVGSGLPADGSRQCCVGSDCQQMDPGSVVWVQIASRWIQAVLWVQDCQQMDPGSVVGSGLPADGSRQCCGFRIASGWIQAVLWVQDCQRWSSRRCPFLFLLYLNGLTLVITLNALYPTCTGMYRALFLTCFKWRGKGWGGGCGLCHGGVVIHIVVFISNQTLICIVSTLYRKKQSLFTFL